MFQILITERVIVLELRWRGRRRSRGVSNTNNRKSYSSGAEVEG